MKDGWEVKKLGDVCNFVRGPFGGSLKKNCFKPDGYAVYEQQHAIYDQFEQIRYFIDEKKFEEMKRFELFPGDLIMSCSGTMGKVAIVPKNIKTGIINQALLKLTSNKNLNVEYLNYWMDSKNFQESIAKHSLGAAIKNVASVKILKEIEIPIPPISEQKEIVAILDEAFAAIDRAKANIEKNIENARELFQSRLNEIFSRKGEGWKECNLGDESFLKIIDGDRSKNYPKKSEFLSEGHCIFLNTGNVRPNGFDFQNIVYITEKKDNHLRKGKLQRDDVVMTTRGTIGNLGWYSSEVKYEHIRINSGMLIFRVNKEKILPEYLFTLFRSSVVTKQICEMTSGAAQPQLPIRTLVKFRIPLISDLNEQKKIVRFIKEIDVLEKKLIDNLSLRLVNLEELKKSLLQKAFAGELT